MKKTLVVLAAGMGSRFGGLKQIEPVGPNGEFIIDYSIYDAIRSGFNKVVFIIKEENLEVFKETIGKRIENHIEVEYAFQKITDIPEGYDISGREKPLGTAHALYALRDIVKENFAIINSDDFYGYDAIKKAGDFLENNLVDEKEHYALVGYRVINTITENGSVKRGVCKIESGELVSLEESKIEKIDGGLKATSLNTGEDVSVEENTLVSMNLLGFPREFLDHIVMGMKPFLEANKNDLSTCEYLVPDVLSEQIQKGVADVSVIETNSKWYGMTYKEDKEEVSKAIIDMINEGTYKENLWS